MRERRMTIARTAAAASPPSGVRVSWCGRLSQRHTSPPSVARPGAGSALISRMTRPSSAGSIRTGRRRCRAMRSITSSIGSNTLGLFQHRLELLAGPLDAHLQRGDTRAGEPRHVLVLELLDMLQEERLTRLGRETRQRPSDRVVPLGPPVRSRQRRGLERGGVVDEPAGPNPPARARPAGPGHTEARQAPPQNHAAMPAPLSIPLLAPALLVGGGCYQDVSSSIGPGSVKPIAKVLLPDAPFPYDALSSVNLHVVRIEASHEPDTSVSGNWVLITEPRK